MIKKIEKKSPRYKMLTEELRSEILSGRILEDSLLPGENAIAREKGVSRVTVRSAIFNLRREGLIQTIPGLGHKVNRKTNVFKDTRPILFLGRRDGITPILFEAVHSAAMEKGFDCRLKSYSNSFDSDTINLDEEFLSDIDYRDYSGIIFFSDKKPSKNFMEIIEKHNIAILFVGYNSSGFDSVLSDSAGGARVICDELYKRDFKKFIYVSDKYLEENVETFKLRSKTIIKHTAKLSIEFRQINLLYNNPLYDVNKKQMKKLLYLIDEGYNCIIASNAYLANGIRHFLYSKGHRIPESLSLATFSSDGNYFRENGKLCRLGGVEERWKDIGISAFERFIARKKNPQICPAQILISMIFIDGDTIEKKEK